MHSISFSYSRMIVLLALSILFGTTATAQINVTANHTAVALAQKLAGQGITILNPTITCAASGNGIFNTVTSNLGLDSGILLTTGRSATVGGSIGANGFASSLADVQQGMPGDAQLNAAAGINVSVDACKLEFDVVPKGDTIKFNYVFGSEEYTNSICAQYNDAFAFFISGPGIPGVRNIALVPGTSIPVAVNSVNNGIPGTYSNGTLSQCQAMGAGSPFTSYYVDNNGGTSVTYRGFTKVLTAVHAVQPCDTYHLKLVVADALNGRYDSGVFIEAGSLQAPSFDVKLIEGVPGVDTFIVKGCSPAKLRFTTTQRRATPQVLTYTLGGTAVGGVDYGNIPASITIPALDTSVDLLITGLPTAANGTKNLKLYLYSPYSCNGLEVIDSITLDILDAPSLNISAKDTAVCLGAIFSLNVLGTTDSLRFAWTPATGLNDPAIRSPFITATSDITYTVTGTWPGTGCADLKDTISIRVKEQPVVEAGENQLLCSGVNVLLSGTVTPASQMYEYVWRGPGDYESNLPNPVIPAITEKNSGIYQLSVSVEGCAPASDVVDIIVKEVPKVQLDDTVKICEGQQLALQPDIKPTTYSYAYSWYGPGNFVSESKEVTIKDAMPLASGDYVLKVSYDNCESIIDTVFVKVVTRPEAPVLTKTETFIQLCQADQAKPLSALGYYDLKWYLDTFRTGQSVAPIPETGEVGEYRYFVTHSVDGCESPKSIITYRVEKCCEQEVYIPNAFTPNGDGRNDGFGVPPSADYDVTQMNIFNRWGQPVFQSNTKNDQWNGMFNGTKAELGTYYYYISIVCRNGVYKQYKGEVILIR